MHQNNSEEEEEEEEEKKSHYGQEQYKNLPECERQSSTEYRKIINFLAIYPFFFN